MHTIKQDFTAERFFILALHTPTHYIRCSICLGTGLISEIFDLIQYPHTLQAPTPHTPHTLR